MVRNYTSEVQHWRRIAKMSRVVGIWFIFGGLALLVSGIRLAGHLEEPFAINGAEDHRLGPRLVLAAAGVIVALLGVGLVWTRAYRPDLGDRNILDRFVDPF